MEGIPVGEDSEDFRRQLAIQKYSHLGYQQWENFYGSTETYSSIKWGTEDDLA